MSAVVEVIVEPAPCDGCARTERCAAQILACAAFESFVVYGGLKWRGIEPRSPSASIYARIFQGAVTSLA